MFVSSTQMEIFEFFSCLIVNLCISDVTQSIVLQFVVKPKQTYSVFLSFFLGKCDCFIWNGPVKFHVIIG